MTSAFSVETMLLMPAISLALRCVSPPDNNSVKKLLELPLLSGIGEVAGMSASVNIRGYFHKLAAIHSARRSNSGTVFRCHPVFH